MKLFSPRSLFTRLVLIWLVGITLILAISFNLFINERARIGHQALFEGLAQEITAAVQILDRLPPDERTALINEIGRRRLRFTLTPQPAQAKTLTDNHPLYKALANALSGYHFQLHSFLRPEGHTFLITTVTLTDGSNLSAWFSGQGPGLMKGRGSGSGHHFPPVLTPYGYLTGLGVLAGGVILLTWFAVRIATRPLSRMAEAARRLGENPECAPMDTSGTTEVAQAAIAFNQMQQRILNHVNERTRILAAISHDLQTPITRLRLRAEMIENDTLRTRIQADLDAMQTLIREGLDYAKSIDSHASPQPVDLTGLAEALRDDAEDMGWQVSLSGTISRPCLAQPMALRRALWNLIGNGIKFGDHVDLQLTMLPAHAEIRIRDYGPGLSETELEKVFEPFYRTEASRNRETGGTGLGLAIARNLLKTQNGTVKLKNHPAGGLEAVITLPLAPQKTTPAKTIESLWHKN